ncbi:unnamed protein product [Allacma fusca]|uniref:Uncharacterized protein n=1 Tax=Allacma fusca TaxID=39272 RepID=A0A8J2NR43_9HEXA|nr:unnamed protein product [Allacma fusca]
MCPKITPEVATRILVLSEEGYPYKRIQEELLDAVFNVFQGGIHDVFKYKAKRREAEAKGLPDPKTKRRKIVRNPGNIRKLKQLASVAKPSSQRVMARKLNTSVRTGNRMIHEDLDSNTRKTKGERRIFYTKEKNHEETFARFTADYSWDLKDRTGVRSILNSAIPLKSPDASPLVFYGFGFLKQSLLNRNRDYVEWTLERFKREVE